MLEYNLIKSFLELLEMQFSQEKKYDFKHGKKTESGLKSVQEITVSKIMIQDLAEFCTNKQKEFRI